MLPACGEHQVLLEREVLVQLHPGQQLLVEVEVKLRLCQLHLVEVVVQCCRDPPFLHLAEVVVKLSLRLVKHVGIALNLSLGLLHVLPTQRFGLPPAHLRGYQVPRITSTGGTN